MFLDGFILLLRDYGVPVSLTDSIDFYRGMERGLAPDLDSLFVFARLCFVRRVEHMDSYERAFAFHFYGIDLPRVAAGDPELLNTPQFRQWLKEAVRRGELPPRPARPHRGGAVDRQRRHLDAPPRRSHPPAVRQGTQPHQALPHLFLPQHGLQRGLQGRAAPPAVTPAGAAEALAEYATDHPR